MPCCPAMPCAHANGGRHSMTRAWTFLRPLTCFPVMANLVRMITRKIVGATSHSPPPQPPPPTPPPPSGPKIWFEDCKIQDFELGKVLGAGSFGRVSVATHLKTHHVCAAKSLSKAAIIKSKQIEHVKAEKESLQKIDFPFIVNLHGCCQDNKCVHLIMEYISGGDFFGYLRGKGRFDENTARFYAAQVLLAFEYIHNMNIIYRDLKPENLLLDEKGNIKIADFGFAKKIEHRTFTLCGTPDYLAPEILLNKGHGKPVDWWTFGVLIYEMLAGYPPFYDEDVTGTYQKILDGKLLFPSHFSKHAKDLIRKLLTADLTKRIGCLKDGVTEIKNHPWFSGVKWDNMLCKRETAPLKPKPLASPNDTSNFDCSSVGATTEISAVLTDEEQAMFRDL